MKIVYKLIILILFIQSANSEDLSETETKGSYNILYLFAGTTLIPHSEAIAVNIGLGYEHKLKGVFGFGINASTYFYDYIEFTGTLPFYYHPLQSLMLWIQPGLAFTKSISYSRNVPSTDQSGNPIIIYESNKYTANFLCGIGMGYSFIMKKDYPQIIITPSFNADFVNFDKPYITGLVKIEYKLSINTNIK